MRVLRFLLKLAVTLGALLVLFSLAFGELVLTFWVERGDTGDFTVWAFLRIAVEVALIGLALLGLGFLFRRISKYVNSRKELGSWLSQR